MKFLHHHKKLERHSILFLIGMVLAVLVGGIVQIIPLFRAETVIEPVKGVRPYTPLELAGQNIYIREGCYLCHSQQIRPLRDEVARYGHYSLAAESMYDHPFQWGSKRTGPDLARVGGKYSDEWHRAHMIEPRDLVPESIMPSYGFLMHRGLDVADMKYHLRRLRLVGVPYTPEMIDNASNDLTIQAHDDPEGADALRARYGEKVHIRDFDGNPALVSEMDALISYLQVLGTMAEIVDFEPAPASLSAAPVAAEKSEAP